MLPLESAVKTRQETANCFVLQAKDGIGDWSVTGVQTCALPIYALIEMTAESGGTTTPNGPQYFHVLPMEPMAVSFDERLSGSADDVGHLQRRPAHLVLVRRLVVQG